MGNWKPIIGINLALLLLYTIAVAIYGYDSNGTKYNSLGIAIFMLIGSGIHTIILLIMSIVFFIKKDKPKGKAYLLAALLVLVIGFSACTGLAS